MGLALRYGLPCYYACNNASKTFKWLGPVSDICVPIGLGLYSSPCWAFIYYQALCSCCVSHCLIFPQVESCITGLQAEWSSEAVAGRV